MRISTGAKWLAPIAALVLVMAVATPAFADDPHVVVSAQVQPQDYGIVLDSGSSLNYGTPQLGVNSVGDIYNTPITVRNVGTVPCGLRVIGDDPNNGMGQSWYLSDMQGSDQAVWNIQGNMYSVNVKDSMYGSQMIGDWLYPGQSYQYWAYLNMPTSSAGYGTYSFDANIYATAP